MVNHKKLTIKKAGKKKTTPEKVFVEPEVQKRPPILRMFKCLVSLELVQTLLGEVSIFAGKDGERMRELVTATHSNLIELESLYTKQWKEERDTFERG